MKSTKFARMSEAELKAYRPESEDDYEASSKEMKIVEMCKENGDDPDNEDIRQALREAVQETEKWWEDLSDEDREGWEHNMTKE